MNTGKYSHFELRDVELSYLSDCVSSGEIFTGWLFVRRIEAAFNSHFNCRHAVAIGDGLDPLSLALEGVDLKEGDEVILPALAAQEDVEAVMSRGAIPTLVDVRLDTWGLDAESVLRALSMDTRIVLLKQKFEDGSTRNRLYDLSRLHRFGLVEDLTTVPHGYLGNVGQGERSIIGIYRFSDPLSLISGRGGICLMDDDELNEKLLSALGGARSSRFASMRIQREDKGMSNLQAAVIYVQLERWKEFQEKRVGIVQRYRSETKSLGFQFPASSTSGENMVVPAVLVPDDIKKEKLVGFLRMRGINCTSISGKAMNMNGVQRCGSLPAAQEIAARGMILPFHTTLDPKQQNYIIGNIKHFINGQRAGTISLYRKREVYP